MASSYQDIKKRVSSNGTNKTKSGYETIKEKVRSGGYTINNGVDQKYIDSFITDANSFLTANKTGEASEYDTYSDLTNRSKNISTWLNVNKSRYDDSTVKGLTDLLSSFADSTSAYGQFKDSTDYSKGMVGWLNPEAAVDSTTVAGRKKIYESNLAEIEEIEKSLPWYEGGVTPDFIENIFLTPEQEALRDKKNRLEAENRQYERSQKALDDGYIDITPEVVETATNRDFNNPTREDLATDDAKIRDIDDGFRTGRYTYGFSGNVVNAYTGEEIYSADDPYVSVMRDGGDYSLIADKFGVWASSTAEDRADAYEMLAGGINDSWASAVNDGERLYWDHLTPDEITTYYYYLNTEGQDRAYQFLDSLETELGRRATEERAEDIAEADLLERIALNIASVPQNVVGGLLGAYEDAYHLLEGEEINPYSAAHQTLNDAQAIRESTAKRIDDFMGGAEIPWLEFGFGDAYQALMSGADSIVGGFMLGPTAYGTLMGTSAASSTMRDLYERGASGFQIAAGGLLAGAAEGVFEKFSIDNLINLKTAKNTLQVLKNVLIQGGVEASEEALTEIANAISDGIIMGSESNWTSAENFAKDVINAGLGGFISGAGMGGGASAMQNIGYTAQAGQIGATIINNGQVNELQKLALEMYSNEGGSDAKQAVKLAGKVADSVARGKKPSAATVGKLADLYAKGKDRQDIANITKELTAEGLTEEEATKVAEFAAKVGRGEEVSQIEATDIEKITAKISAAETTEDTETGISSPEAEEAAVGKISASERGKATVGDTDVEIAEFASIKDGKATLKLKDGSTVEMDEVVFSSPAESTLYESAVRQGMNAATANAFVRGYDGSQSVFDYALGFAEAYRYGNYGFPVAEMSRDGFSASLNVAQKNLAYGLGKTDRTYAEAPKTKTASEGKVHFVGAAAVRQGLTERQKASVKGIEKIAEALGIDFYFFESPVDAEGKRVGANGWFDTKDNSIHIDIAAGADGNGVMLFTAAHEITHFVRKWSPEKFDTFATFLLENYAEKGVSIETLVQNQISKAKNNGREITWDEAYEEVIADSCESFLADGDAINKIAELKAKDKTLWEAIRDFLAELVDRIKAAYNGLRPDSFEGRYVAEMLDSAEALREMWIEAVADASKAYNEAELVAVDASSESVSPAFSERFNSEDSDIRYSERASEKDGKGLSKRYNESSIKQALWEAIDHKDEGDDNLIKVSRMPIYVVEKLGIDGDVYIYRNHAYENMVSKERAIADGRPVKRGGKDIHFHNLGIEKMTRALLSIDDPTMVIETKTKEGNPAVLMVLNEFGNNGAPLYAILSFYSNRGINGEFSVKPHIVLTIAERNYTENGSGRSGYNEIIKNAIKDGRVLDYNEKRRDDLSVIAKPTRLGNITKSSLEKSIAQFRKKVNAFKEKNKISYSDRDSSYLEAVNRGDMETAQRMVDEAAREAGYDYHLYHGTNADFTKFDLLKHGGVNGKGEGYGIYLAANREISAPYGKNVIDAYTKFNRLAEGRKKTLSYNEVKKLVKRSCEVEAKQMIDDEEYDSISEALKDTWVSNVVYTYGYSNIEQIYADVANMLWKENDNDGDLINEMMALSGANYDYKNALKFYETVLTPTTGIDGFHYIWGNKDGSGEQNDIYLAFNSEQIKSADPVTYDDNGNVIPLSKRFNTEDSDIRYSERDTSVSNRALLANALESVAQNDIERKRLTEYKAKIESLDKDQARLAEVRAEINTLYRTYDKTATKEQKQVRQARLTTLRAEAKELGERISKADRELLKLEANEAIKNLVARERNRSYASAMARGRENLAAREKEMRQEFKERVHRSVEKREATAIRTSIKKKVDDLNKLLLKPTNTRYVLEGLRKPLADALSAINMDTVGADERIAVHNAEITKLDARIEAETNEAVRAALESARKALIEKRDRVAGQGVRLAERMAILKAAYAKIESCNDDGLRNSYQETITNAIDDLEQTAGDTSIRNMTMEQLEKVNDILKMIKKTLSDANKAFKLKRTESIGDAAEAVFREIGSLNRNKYMRVSAIKEIEKVGWDLLKPYYAFRTIGSDTLTEMYQNLRDGEDAYWKDVKKAQDFIKEQREKYHYYEWKDEPMSFKARNGKTFELSLEERLTIYAYHKREASHEHLLQGGFVFEDAVTVTKKHKGIPIKYEVTTKDAFSITDELFVEIANTVAQNADQKAYADAMQEYLSTTLAEQGNSVSMELLGVKLFKEKYYLPIKSSDLYRKFDPKVAGEVKLKNPSFSKATVPKANNPIVLHNFSDLWTEHCIDMAMYSSFVLALEDFTRVYNYKTPTSAETDTREIKADLESSYPGVTKYINNFLRDLNGGVRTETITTAEKFMGLAKKGAVVGSLSVAIQQPSAIMRAMAIINPRYFIAKPERWTPKKHREAFEKIKKYAGIAGIKQMGGFDMISTRGTSDWIKAEPTAKNKVDEVLSMPPAYMDELAWVAIWNAVERETVSAHKDVQPRSEEFYKIVGKRFTEVVSLTQVYDSVFSRSGVMRNRSFIAKSLTAFAGEPITSLNMMWDGMIQASRTSGGKAKAAAIGRSSGAVLSSIVVNSALKAIVLAMRDDDEEQSLLEKYIEAFAGDLKDNMNPLTMIPFVKDIVSIFKGYDVERMDMALFSDLQRAVSAFDSDEKSLYEKWSGLAGAISAFFGIPLKNVERDIRAVLNTFFGKKEKTTAQGILTAITEGWSGGNVSNSKEYYNAIMSGNKAHIARVKARFEDESEANSALAREVKTAFKEGDISGKKAISLLVNYGGKTEEEAASKVEYWEFQVKHPEEEYKDFSESDVARYKEIESTISLDEYAEYLEAKEGCSGKAEILDAINSLPISARKKDALYYVNGWAKSTIGEAPWH